ncbi:MAG: hypothetical protein HC819_05710 [Cyclobacteriaceae bacterium]|nr:hypothetical protein [Cyclobacteriaceae bacterium]
MKPLLEHEKALLKYNHETNAIELIWKQYHDEDTYRLMFSRGVDFLKVYRATAWLSDTRNEGEVDSESSDWLHKEIIPKAISYGLKKIAVVIDQKKYKMSDVNNLSPITGKEVMQYFDSIESANEWLKKPK